MPSRNPYVLRNSLWQTNTQWDDLNADTRALILRFSDRRVEFEDVSWQDLPDELLPAENLANWRASRGPSDSDEDDDSECPEFQVDTIQKRVFARERHGILGPLTVSFSDCVDTDWWGFQEVNYNAPDRGELDLDPGPICAALDYDETWTGITKIRLPLEVQEHCRFYSYEFVREAHNGQQYMVIAPPADIFCILNPAEKTQCAQALVEKLHLQHAVVNGVDEFSV